MQTATIDPKFPVFAQRFVQEKRLLSICPMSRQKEMPCGQGLYMFKIEAQPRGKYQILVIGDSYQMMPDYSGIESNGGNYAMKPMPKPAEVIASSLAREWNASPAMRGGLGVRVMPDSMVEGSSEFNAFMAEMTADLRACAEWANYDAADKHTNGQGISISPFHRIMAEWMYGDQVENLAWYNMRAVANIKKCVACSATIDNAAKVCKICSTDLIKYFKEYELTKEDDPFIWSWVQGRAKIPQATEGETVRMDVPLLKVTIKEELLPGEVRANVIQVLSAEQKAKMNQHAGQAKRDAYLVTLIPELANEHPGLRRMLVERGYAEG